MVRVVCMADTHCAQHELEVPPGDILIHAGDALCDGTLAEFLGFLAWLGALPHRVKIYVPGNHDEIVYWEEAKARGLVPPGVYLLIGEGVTVDGYLEVWGAPWTPGLKPSAEWQGKATATAFTLPENDRKAAWERAPAALDILVCHVPPMHLLKGEGEDEEELMLVEGDDLVNLAICRARPRLVVCGHVHRARGVYRVRNGRGETLVVNAACMGKDFQVLQPIVIDI